MFFVLLCRRGGCAHRQRVQYRRCRCLWGGGGGGGHACSIASGRGRRCEALHRHEQSGQRRRDVRGPGSADGGTRRASRGRAPPTQSIHTQPCTIKIQLMRCLGEASTLGFKLAHTAVKVLLLPTQAVLFALEDRVAQETLVGGVLNRAARRHAVKECLLLPLDDARTLVELTLQVVDFLMVMRRCGISRRRVSVSTGLRRGRYLAIGLLLVKKACFLKRGIPTVVLPHSGCYQKLLELERSVQMYSRSTEQTAHDCSPYLTIFKIMPCTHFHALVVMCTCATAAVPCWKANCRHHCMN